MFQCCELASKSSMAAGVGREAGRLDGQQRRSACEARKIGDGVMASSRVAECNDARCWSSARIGRVACPRAASLCIHSSQSWRLESVGRV